jgi:hypothetical protein
VHSSSSSSSSSSSGGVEEDFLCQNNNKRRPTEAAYKMCEAAKKTLLQNVGKTMEALNTNFTL